MSTKKEKKKTEKGNGDEDDSAKKKKTEKGNGDEDDSAKKKKTEKGNGDEDDSAKNKKKEKGNGDEDDSTKKTKKKEKGNGDEDDSTKKKKKKEKGNGDEDDSTKKKKTEKGNGDEDDSAKKKNKKKEKTKKEKQSGGDHVKILHFVWFGNGRPGIEDMNYLNMWAGLSDEGWKVHLWSDTPNRDWIPEGVTYRDIAEIEKLMSGAMGKDEWGTMLKIVKDESTPTRVLERPKDGTEEATLKKVQDMTTKAIGSERRALGNGANYAAASDIIRVAVLYCFGGFYIDMASYPGGLDPIVEGDLAKRLETFVKVADVPPSEGAATTVLWVGHPDFKVNNAFLGSSTPMNPFYLYFLKSMHNAYNKLVYNPDPKSVTAYLTKFAKGKAKVDKKRLAKYLKDEDGFMRTMKRLAARALTLYTSGPYLLRCCLFYFFHEAKEGKAKVPTVDQVCQYVIDTEDKLPKDSTVRVKHKTDIEAKSRMEKRPVCYEKQYDHFVKVQRGSWDQDPVLGYFADVFIGREAEDRTLAIAIPEDLDSAVTVLHREAKYALVTRHLAQYYEQNRSFDVVDDLSYFTQRPLKEGDVDMSFKTEEDIHKTGYRDFLKFCKDEKIENTLNLCNKLVELELRREEYPRYMKVLVKIWEMFLQDGAKLAVVGEMDQESEEFGRFTACVAEITAVYPKYWKKGAAVFDE